MGGSEAFISLTLILAVVRIVEALHMFERIPLRSTTSPLRSRVHVIRVRQPVKSVRIPMGYYEKLCYLIRRKIGKAEETGRCDCERTGC